MKLLFTNESLRRKIASDLDDEPTAGGEALADLGAAHEREACAKVCNDYIGCEQVARDIRVRGEKP